MIKQEMLPITPWIRKTKRHDGRNSLIFGEGLPAHRPGEPRHSQQNHLIGAGVADCDGRIFGDIRPTMRSHPARITHTIQQNNYIR